MGVMQMRDKHYKFLGVQLILVPGLRYPWIFVARGKMFWFGVPTPVIKFFRFVRDLFPSFWAVGLRCCDHYGHVQSWYFVLALNGWHLRRLEKYYDGWGDGEVWCQLRFIDFVKSRRKYGRRVHIDDLER